MANFYLFLAKTKQPLSTFLLASRKSVKDLNSYILVWVNNLQSNKSKWIAEDQIGGYIVVMC